MLTIWVLSDGKRGHENQSLGLAEALARKTASRIEVIPVERSPGWMFHWLLGRFPPGKNRSKPDLILAAGHATHMPLLAARRAFGGKAVVLMKPSLPLAWFDRVILPRHEGLKPGGRLRVTDGPLNRIHPDKAAARTARLFLIGGPSPHFDWDSAPIIRQIRSIAETDPARQWTLATSRRTPADFLAQLQDAAPANLTVVPHEQTDADWLPRQLGQTETVWVSPDSVSMVYEALTAGAGVGLLDLPSRHTRVARSMLSLAETGLVTRFSQGKPPPQPVPAPRFNEADRVADEILQWLNAN